MIPPWRQAHVDAGAVHLVPVPDVAVAAEGVIELPAPAGQIVPWHPKRYFLWKWAN
jgi:hypothetical protein